MSYYLIITSIIYLFYSYFSLFIHQLNLGCLNIIFLRHFLLVFANSTPSQLTLPNPHAPPLCLVKSSSCVQQFTTSHHLPSWDFKLAILFVVFTIRHRTTETWPHRRHQMLPLSHPCPLPSYRRRSPPTTHLHAVGNSAASMSSESTSIHLRQIVAAALLLAAVSLSCLLLLRDADYSLFASSYPFPRFPTVFPLVSNDSATVS